MSVVALTFLSCKKDKDAAGDDDSPKGPWSVELTAECDNEFTQIFDTVRNIFRFSIAGTGAFSIDWGDGIVQQDIPLQLEDPWINEKGVTVLYKEYSHAYDKEGDYRIKITGKDGRLTFFSCNHWGNYWGGHWVYDGHYNFYTSLQLTNCSQLEELDCSSNQLTSLDVSKCTKLDTLDCSSNLLTSLDISKNTQLVELSCSDNQLTSLDISKCTELETLRCEDNLVISLGIGKNNTKLKTLYYDNRVAPAVMNKIYNDLPLRPARDGFIQVNRASRGDYSIAEYKGWQVFWH